MRSDAYIDYFSSLDHDGGFFYERWGDAPVHSIAAAILLRKDQIHFFNEIAYYHVPFTHCPIAEQTRLDLRCSCKPDVNFDWKGYSCKPPLLLDDAFSNFIAGTHRWFKVNHMQKPEGWDIRD